jgi:glycine/D-amino acid oxidase-like deaminating enzyme
VAAGLGRLQPALADLALAASWTGPIDRTIDGLPFFTSLGRPDLICGLGYSGNGVAPSLVGAKILASMALGRDDEWSRCGLVRPAPGGLPPEPVRYLGGQFVRAAVARKERAEDAERTPSWIDRRLTSLAPAGLVPID